MANQQKQPRKREVYLLKNKIIDGEPCGPDYETKVVEIEESLANWWCDNGVACDPKSEEAKRAAKNAKVQTRDPKPENRDPS